MKVRPPTILAVASFEKGQDFLRQAKALGARVLLLTSQSLQGVAKWPTESIDGLYYLRDKDKTWEREETIKAVSYLARTEPIDRIVALDDFDLENAAALREHLRVPGLGESATRHFRDKLAMRVRAREIGVRVPEFVHICHRDSIRAFCATVPGPWVFKPRHLASSAGIKKMHSVDDVLRRADDLGDDQSMYLLERYLPGDVLHVDSIVEGGEVRFACASAYGKPPLDVSHDGDVFSTKTLVRGSKESDEALAINRDILKAMGHVRGASHTELIRAKADGELYFLETSARVGGAHIAELVEAATGVNLWADWAKVELAEPDAPPYAPAPTRDEHAGLMISLAKDKTPDTSSFDAPEVVWRLEKDHHVGLIVRSPDAARVDSLVDEYTARIRKDFHAYLPPQDKPTA
jgi:biotin carboxylase